MSYGKIEYDNNGFPVCEICGKSFKRVISHVRQVHSMSEREYKLRFGFDLKKGICSKNSSEATRIKTLSNFDKVVKENLLNKGKKTRFKNGDKGRTKDMVQEQTRIRLLDNLKSPKMKEAMKISGKKVGESGLGNKKRWSNNKTI